MPMQWHDLDSPVSPVNPTSPPPAAAHVRVSCPTALVAVLQRIVPALHVRHPGLAMQISGANLTVDLSRGDAEIALRMFPTQDPSIVSLRSIELGWGAYGSRSYVADHGLPASPDELARHRLVLYGAALHRVPGPRWIEERCGPSTKATRVQNPEVAGQVIAAGEGIGVIPCIAALQYANLVRVLPTPVASQATWIVYDQAGVRDLELVRTAAEALRELMAAHADVFAGHAP